MKNRREYIPSLIACYLGLISMIFVSLVLRSRETLGLRVVLSVSSLVAILAFLRVLFLIVREQGEAERSAAWRMVCFGLALGSAGLSVLACIAGVRGMLWHLA